MSAPSKSGSSLPPEVVGSIAELMAALADPKRIALLATLRHGETNVLRLADELDLSSRNASHHVGVLHRAGVLSRRPEGRQVLYGIKDWTALWLVDQAARALADTDI